LSSTLQDLMLQVEILVQYGIGTKRWSGCKESGAFPREEERNEIFSGCKMSAGVTPR
jgi:hypothetical protein